MIFQGFSLLIVKRLDFPKEPKISEGFKNLLKGMLCKEPKKRLTLE